jgi:hydroxylamine oxidation protein HaoB
MKRALPLFGIVLIAGGLFVLGSLAASYWEPSPPPFTYELLAEGKAEKFPELGLTEQADLAVKKYELRVSGVDKPIAGFHVASKDGTPPVLLEWKNYLNEPVLTLTGTMKETKGLAKAIGKYAPGNARILGWWDTSRRLKLLSGSNVVFDENLARPVFVPSMWTGRSDVIVERDRKFWSAPSGNQSVKQFDKLVDALLSDEVVGMAKLRQLVGEGEVYVVLHQSDVFKIGALAPKRISVGYKDFPVSGKMHGQIKRIKEWIKQEGHKAHAVMSISDQLRRVFFLTDVTSTETLIARMLPFDTSNPFRIEGLSVVYQIGGYWVYKLQATKVSANATQSE